MAYLFCLVSILIFSFMALGQNFNYQMKGSYNLESSKKGPVNFTLRWSEDEGKITGEYRDNYFVSKAQVIGTESERGRNFVVIFPEIKRGISTLNILTSNVGTKRTGTSIPVSIITRDAKGNPLTNIATNSRFTATTMTVAQKQEDLCQENFGALRGFCGIYEGLISEIVDRQNKCNLLFADAARLELTPDGSLNFYLSEVADILISPVHQIGRLPANPGNRSIDVMSRVCNSLPGIVSKSNDCKRLSLTGEFYTMGDTPHFRGTYTIYDEGSKNTCSYSLSLDR